MANMTGTILKMSTQLQTPVEYTLPIGGESIAINPYLGKKITFEFTGKIICVGCGRTTKKSFNQGYCFGCFKTKAACDICIVKPELCHYSQGTCREPEWAQTHCFVDHIIYLANSSGLKVGITRHTQTPTRWIDQGAIAALPIGRVNSRQQSGIVEVALKQYVADKTQWQKMLKGDIEEIDLEEKRNHLLQHWPENIQGEPLLHEKITCIEYPVLEYPTKVKSLNLDEKPKVEGTLLGIKGQYLILDTGVINIRKYQGYQLSTNFIKD